MNEFIRGTDPSRSNHPGPGNCGPLMNLLSFSEIEEVIFLEADWSKKQYLEYVIYSTL